MAASASVLVLVATGVPLAYASAADGVAEIVQPGQTIPLNSGGSGTQFGLELPSDAHCPGDTAHDSFHVFSFLVPQGTSPTSISFRTGQPNRGLPMIVEPGLYYGAANTAEGSGQIVDVPPEFVWTRFTAKLLLPAGQPDAVWEAGIACANVSGQVTNYWTVGVRFAASSRDPRGFTWAVLARQAAPSSSNGWYVAGPFAAAAVFGAVSIVLYRRRRPKPPKAIKSIT